MRITMVGHSTVLIEVGGLRILTDPFFLRGNRSPVSPRHRSPSGDYVPNSHDHG